MNRPISFDRPTYLQGLPDGHSVMVCQECGSLVSVYSEDAHRQWHEYVSGKENVDD